MALQISKYKAHHRNRLILMGIQNFVVQNQNVEDPKEQ